MRLLTSIVVLALPGIVFAAPTSFKELTDALLKILNAGITTVLILGLVIYLYGVSTSLPKLKTDDVDRLRVHFVWGILALFVMVSVWGILALVQNTVFSSGIGSGTQNAKPCASYSECVLGDTKK